MSDQPSFLDDRKDELTEILRSRLIECGWRDQVANMCRNLIQKHGVEQIRLEDIIGEVRPKAKQIIPEQVKTELLEIMRNFGQNQLQQPQSIKHEKKQQQSHLNHQQLIIEEQPTRQSQNPTESCSNISLL